MTPAEVTHAALLEPGEVYEVRIPKPFGKKRVVSGVYDDQEKMLRDAAAWSGRAEAVYFTINPVNPALKARSYNRLTDYAASTTSDPDITHRFRMLIDTDPTRPAGISSSEGEHAAALARTAEVHAWLMKECGWPDMPMADSGNGGHLLPRIDLPNDEASRDLISRVLAALAFRFDDDAVKIDQTVENAARISKVYGTMACKGDDLPERPHRLSQLLHMPAQEETVTQEMLERVAATLPVAKEAPTAGTSRTAAAGTPFDIDQWIGRSGLQVSRSGPWQGGRKWILAACAWNPDHTDKSAYILQLPSGAVAAGCQHNGCRGKGWHDLRDVVEPGWGDRKNNGTAQNRTYEERRGSADGTPNGGNNGFAGFAGNEGKESPVFSDAPRSLSVELLPVPVLESEMLPAPLREWVDDIAARVSCPREYPAAAVLIGLSAVVGRKIGICPKRRDDWIVVPNLWGALVGPPGALKTPAVMDAFKPLHRLEADARAEYDLDMEAHQIAVTVAKARSEGARDKMRKEARKDASDDRLRSLAMEAAASEPEAPTCRRFTVNDSTVEKLGELLRDNPNGLMLSRDELTGFFKTLERQGHESDRAFYLEAWSGTGSFTSDRIGRGTVFIESVCLSLFGTIQPGPLARFLRGAGGGEEADGFAQRLQVLVYPDPPKKFRNIDEWPNKPAKERAYDVFRSLSRLTAETAGAEIPLDHAIPYLRFAPDAQELFDTWREALENRLLSGSDTPLMQTHLSKYRKLMPALALLFHLVDTVDGADRGPVSASAANLSIKWCSFLEAHARRVYQSVMDGDPEAAQRLAERIKQSLPNPFTSRQVVKKGWAGLSTPEEVERAVGLLEDRNWVKSVETPTSDKGGRPSIQVYINPQLYPGDTKKTETNEEDEHGKTGKTQSATTEKNGAYEGATTGKTGRTSVDYEEGVL